MKLLMVVCLFGLVGNAFAASGSKVCDQPRDEKTSKDSKVTLSVDSRGDITEAEVEIPNRNPETIPCRKTSSPARADKYLEVECGKREADQGFLVSYREGGFAGESNGYVTV